MEEENVETVENAENNLRVGLTGTGEVSFIKPPNLVGAHLTLVYDDGQTAQTMVTRKAGAEALLIKIENAATPHERA